MLEEKKRQGNARMFVVVGVILAAVVIAGAIASGVFNGPRPAESTSPSTQPAKTPETPTAPTDKEPAAIATPAAPKLSMAQVIARAKTWEPAYIQYIGIPSPEIVARDLDGKSVKLSDYKGRNVLVVFWAMWCPPCKEEIPGLIKLRRTMPEDKLAIIAISTDRMSDDPIANNTMYGELVAKLKRFVASYKMNYTVVTLPGHLEGPYAQVNSLPSTFFIDPEGRIKLATAGAMSLKDVEAVLAADK